MATTSKSGANAAAKSSSVSIGTPSKKAKMEGSEFHQFFVDELKDIYWAEKHLAKALPKMEKAATNTELANAFKKHTEETSTHIGTLEQVFQLLDEKVQAKKMRCYGRFAQRSSGYH